MRKRWKRAIAVMMFAAVMVSGCGSNTAKKSSAEEPVHITFGHGQAEGHPYHIAALQFKKEVEKKTDHRVIVDVQPNGNLGDEREMTEGLQLGTIDITVAVAATLSGFDSDLDVFNFPYLFDSREEAFKVLDGKTGQKIFKGLEKQGIETYGTFDLGFRSMTNSKHPIETPGECKRYPYENTGKFSLCRFVKRTWNKCSIDELWRIIYSIADQSSRRTGESSL